MMFLAEHWFELSLIGPFIVILFVMYDTITNMITTGECWPNGDGPFEIVAYVAAIMMVAQYAIIAVLFVVQHAKIACIIILVLAVLYFPFVVYAKIQYKKRQFLAKLKGEDK